jgi:hypothetical protein
MSRIVFALSLQKRLGSGTDSHSNEGTMFDIHLTIVNSEQAAVAAAVFTAMAAAMAGVPVATLPR